jgi:hypothetical protein
MVLVVRDPINRFISSFFHTKIDKELEDDIPFNLIIDKFRDFLTYYEENSDKINDPHVYSQLWDYRKKGVDISDNPKFKIHHLEDIHKGFSEMRRGWKGTDNIDYKGMIHNFFEGVEFNNQLPIFKDLGIDLEKWDKFHIITLYYYTLTHLNNHHRNKSEGFRDVLKNRHSYLYNKMVKLFCKENDILGYKMDL